MLMVDHIIQIMYFVFYTHQTESLSVISPPCQYFPKSDTVSLQATLPIGIYVCFHASLSGLRPALPDLPSSSPSSRLVSL